MRSLMISLLVLSGLGLVYQAVAQTAPPFKLSSKTFKDGDTVPLSVVYDKMGCKGGNTSPDLSWEGEPAGTQSYAVTLYDPDANTGSGFWHWTMFDIPASVHHLAAGAGDKGSKTCPRAPRWAATTSATPTSMVPVRLRPTRPMPISTRCMR